MSRRPNLKVDVKGEMGQTDEDDLLDSWRKNKDDAKLLRLVLKRRRAEARARNQVSEINKRALRTAKTSTNPKKRLEEGPIPAVRVKNEASFLVERLKTAIRSKNDWNSKLKDPMIRFEATNSPL